MNAKPVLNHCRALQIAARCFSLGANAPIVERITGISRYTLCGMFFSADDQDRPKRGKRPANTAKLHRGNLFLSVQSSFFYSTYHYLRHRGHQPSEALIAAFETYLRHFSPNQLLNFDLCFVILREADSFWSPTKAPGSLCLAVCRHCRSEYLAPAGTTARVDHPCPFCRLSTLCRSHRSVLDYLDGGPLPVLNQNVTATNDHPEPGTSKLRKSSPALSSPNHCHAC
jgi:Flagellar transcriptional activator (FlhC)